MDRTKRTSALHTIRNFLAAAERKAHPAWPEEAIQNKVTQNIIPLAQANNGRIRRVLRKIRESL